MHMRSVTSKILAALVTATLAVVLLAISPPAQACACGGVVGPNGVRTTVSQEIAMVTHHGGTETIEMQLDLTSDGDDVGLVVPTPAPAKVSLGDGQTFDDLSWASRPREKTDRHLFGPPALFGDETDGAAATGAPTGEAVRPLRTVHLGPLDATVLQADDPKALATWLDRHGYRMKPGLAKQVKPYVRMKWSFVAVRLTTKGKQLDGELPPLVMKFASDRLIYPMRMSRAASTAQGVMTYVLAEHRMRRTDSTAKARRGVTAPVVEFAGKVDPASVRSSELRRQLHKTPYLTTIGQTFADPARAITSDLTFERADSDAGFERTYTTEEYIVPIDIAIIGLVLLAGAAVGVAAWIRSSRRRRRDARPA